MRVNATTTMAERDRVLDDFQACTGIENFDECIAILEQHDWSLMDAVKSAMPDTSQTPASFAPASSQSTIDTVFGRRILPTYADSGGSAMLPPGGIEASTSSSAKAPVRLIHFNVEFRKRTIPLVVNDSETVGKLKELLEDELSIAVDKQQLSGWFNKHDTSITDNDVLRDLHLPKENTLFLLVPDLPTKSTCSSGNSTKTGCDLIDRLSQNFTLNIHYKEKDKLYQLHFVGSRTILEVKSDVYSITDVPVRHQVWNGWPDAANDDTMTLAFSGIGYPCHNLELSSLVQPDERLPAHPTNTQNEDVEDGSDDDFEDAQDSFGIDDDMFEAETSNARRQEPLMPENCTDQTAALESFVAEFSNRYGDCHPVFYIGKLESAIADALHCRARDRKLLAIYLHHDDSILTNVFCSQILCSETIVSYLSNNFITWAWDLTLESNKARLLTLCTNNFGSTAAATIRNFRNFRPNELPLLLIFSRSRSSNEVANVIHGNTTLDELMTQLVHAVEVFNGQLQTEIAEEDERDAREMMKREQDTAYQLSLAADQAKAEIKRQEEEEKKKQVAVEERQRQCEEEARLEEEAAKEAIRLSVLDHLPEEPSADCPERVSCLRFRCPQGEVITRRFLANSSLQVALNFLVVRGYDLSNMKLLTTFPRRDLMQVDSTQSLEQLKLYPQETLIVEEN